VGARDFDQLTCFREAGLIGFLDYSLRHLEHADRDVPKSQVTSRPALHAPVESQLTGGGVPGLSVESLAGGSQTVATVH
jgi:hypothetical protein